MELTATKLWEPPPSESQRATVPLWNRNFIMLVIGQIVSLFGNAILRFALPMYILLESGSPELMGRVLGLSFIPMIIISPFGGVLADRVNKKRLIVFLDFFTAGAAFIYLWAIGALSIVPITIIMLMLLIAINSMMASATDSSYPLIVPADELVRANSVTMAVNTLSLMLGPMLGGILLVQFGLTSLLLVAGICFALAAIMETFIRIPIVKQVPSGNMLRLIARDMSDSIRFAVKTEPVMAKILATVVMVNFILSGFAFIGIPVLIIQNLGFDERLVGISSGIMGAGGIIGGILSGLLGKKVRIQKGHRIIIIASLCMIPIGLVFLLPVYNIIAYITMTAMMFTAMGVITILTIQVMAFTQRITPPELLGKIIALIMTSTVLAQPFGNWMYGELFGRFGTTPWLILFPASFLAIIVALWSRTFFKRIPYEPAFAAAAAAPDVSAMATAAATANTAAAAPAFVPHFVPQMEGRYLTAVINSNSYIQRVKMELVNEQEMGINGVFNINISCKDTNITLYKSDTSSLIIKEYKSIGRGNCNFNIANSGNAINISEGKRPIFFGSLKYITAVYVPEKFTGNINLKIGDGNVQLIDSLTFDSLTVECQDGHIKVNGLTARKIKLQTSAGKVQCKTIIGDMEVHTKDGSICVEDLNGSISAKANSGKIKCTATKPSGKILLAADDGSITLNIPRDLYFRFSAKTSGRIITPFMDSLSRPATDNHTYHGVIGREKDSENEALEIKVSVKDYRITVNWID